MAKGGENHAHAEAVNFMVWLLGEASSNRGWDQAAIAREAERRGVEKLSYNNINAMRNGKRRVTAHNAITLCRLVGASIIEGLYQSGHIDEDEYHAYAKPEALTVEQYRCLKMFRSLPMLEQEMILGTITRLAGGDGISTSMAAEDRHEYG